ncbi:cytochrome-c peroxidase [Elizabethkingia miricola]|uniref:cytochrome-c peroxidase n=1 Tax=Elizabethkingia miricola TaxID=172045 RepID=UPI000B356377|nr:cytochrome c peroxidase [Elizabethkingia miricola]NHQ65905.1 c-type cytochrome [Elizabethkingia miricola]NHQ69618.1 c-type cytochrome [Elizabethkingia miricola]NHQ77739.1 c-type cytochrome [Elizabethkingia miricola]PSL88441.1 cytochrome-c peroxidase [Elizabethkingia miricola]QHQ86565.1 c-type cytochrome [Elizabethkingia miricola]
MFIMINLLQQFGRGSFPPLRILLFLALWTFMSCKNEYEGFSVNKDEAYQLNVPEGFPKMTFDVLGNPITVNGVALGKKLFYEGKLSRNNTISCGFCHIQEYAFTHHGHTVSHGIDDRLGIRNAPPIQNMAFLGNYTWDGVSHNLDERSLVPITTDFEMDSSMPEVTGKLSADSNYKKMFRAAFGDDNITGERVLKALSQFMATMISADSKYDQYRKGQVSFTQQESKGFSLFQQKCASCHSGELFTDESYRNTGMYYNAQFDDKGRYRVTLNIADYMKFRVPSLRNIEYTAPYMHDGRFYSLEAVLNFYSDNVEDQPNLDPLLKQNGHIGIPMANDEKQYIIAFLKTLSDKNFITNPKFSE